MEYNSQREHLIIPEYGRNIQKMVNYAKTIEDREKRTEAAKFIVNVMASINQQNRDAGDYKQTLWDHLFIISQFELDVDSPYPMPAKETLTRKPDKVEYSDNKIRFRHYGKNIEAIIKKAIEYEDGPEKDALIHAIANHLKKSYLNWNRESVDDVAIEKHLEILSDGKLSLSEDQTLTSTSDILARNKTKKKKFVPRSKDNNSKRRRDNYGKKSY
ncbi:MAG: DUF4290 domain-containing protein [Marinilabiliales bacterium]|jgi:hypothetical protein|nr:MAG: DUF4290 domain-containing protein [Marinilabiliales bacterium]